MIASFQMGVPLVLGGPKARREKDDPLCALKTPCMWNAYDTINGVYPLANSSLKNQKQKLHAAINQELGAHYNALGLAETLLENSDACWEKLSSAMDAFWQMLITTTYGESASSMQKLECWEVVRLMLRVFLRELWKVRAGAEAAYNTSDPQVAVGQYLWHMLQAHRVMDKFKGVEFHCHPEIAPSIVNHLFEHRAPKVEVIELRSRVTSRTRPSASSRAT